MNTDPAYWRKIDAEHGRAPASHEEDALRASVEKSETVEFEPVVEKKSLLNTLTFGLIK